MANWELIDYTDSGAPVYVPTCELKRFQHCVAYVMYGAVYVRSRTAWFRDKNLRLHEDAHVQQEAALGKPLFWTLYWLFGVGGYDNNPFEIQADQYADENT